MVNHVYFPSDVRPVSTDCSTNFLKITQLKTAKLRDFNQALYFSTFSLTHYPVFSPQEYCGLKESKSTVK